MALECCRGAGSLILPCRMLGDTGNSCWKEPARDEPCSCSISCGINSVWRIARDDWKPAGLRVEYCRIHCIRRNLVVLVLFVETQLYSKID